MSTGCPIEFQCRFPQKFSNPADHFRAGSVSSGDGAAFHSWLLLFNHSRPISAIFQLIDWGLAVSADWLFVASLVIANVEFLNSQTFGNVVLAVRCKVDASGVRQIGAIVGR